jgi:hypothetical protein
MILVAGFLVVWLALVAMWIGAIVSATRYSDWAYAHAGRSRGGTVALVALTGWIGAAYFWLVIRREVDDYKDVTTHPDVQYRNPPGM